MTPAVIGVSVLSWSFDYLERTSLFVDLNGRLIGINSNDLSYQFVVTDLDLSSSVSSSEFKASSIDVQART